MRPGQESEGSFFRQDPLSGEWVLFAPSRGARPNAFIRSTAEEIKPTDCPFCPGHENETPPEIERRGTADAWTIRVIPNRYPALGSGPADPPSTGSIAAVGPHEVIIDAPTHKHMDEMSHAAVAQLFEVYAERVRAAQAAKGVKAVALFKNDGQNAGESIHHPHTQLLGLPIVPDRIARMATHFDSGCSFCADLTSIPHSVLQSRLIHEEEGFAVVTPFAPRRAYEAWIIPRRHVGSIDEMSAAEIHAFAGMARQTVRAIRRIASGLSFNLCFYQRPVKHTGSFHLYAEVAPRRSVMGGFELETGIMINVVTPEEAAIKLRVLIRG